MTTSLTRTDDPRRSLTSQAATIDRTQPVASAQFLDFGTTPGAPGDAGTEWTTRGQNVVLRYVVARTPGVVVDTTFGSETALVLTGDAAAIDVTWEGTTTSASGHGVVVVPPGAVTVVNTGTADLVLMVRSDEPGWAEQASNHAAYGEWHPRVAPADLWPEPTGPDRVRVYLAKDHPPEPGRFGCIFRTRSFMINLLPANDGPRPTDKLSPHYHDDFEQLSLATHGTYVHHIRYPWLTDQAAWRDDEHVEVGSPSVTVIPPPTIHTSAASGPDLNVLIDLFSPPREDFSAKPGWVLNAEDYPR